MKKRGWRFLIWATAFLMLAQWPLLTALALDASAPTRVPDIGEAVTVYTKDDMVLDYSAYAFSVVDAGGNPVSGGIRGLSNVMKIWLATREQEQFTAYCLDMSRSYPAAITDAGEQALYVADTDALLALFAQVLESDTLANGGSPEHSALFGDLIAAHGPITQFQFGATTTINQAMLDKFNRNERIEFQIAGAQFADGYTLSAPGGGYWMYGFWRNTMVDTHNFVASAWPQGAAYDKMLWVSIPTRPSPLRKCYRTRARTTRGSEARSRRDSRIYPKARSTRYAKA